MLKIAQQQELSTTESAQLFAGLMASDPPAMPRSYAPLVLVLRDEQHAMMGALDGFPREHPQYHFAKALT